MNTIAVVQQFFRKLFAPFRHEEDLSRVEHARLTVEPAWLDHYLMHRDQRSRQGVR